MLVKILSEMATSLGDLDFCTVVYWIPSILLTQRSTFREYLLNVRLAVQQLLKGSPESLESRL